MAQHVVVKLTDDLDGTDANQTVTFSLDGKTYEIDLSDDNATAMRETMRTYVEHGRRVGGTSSSRARNSGTTPRQDPQAIRVWADEQGIAVPARGRIPRTVVEQWKAATGG